MSTNIISALGAGSGIDTKALAKDLMEATRAPRKAVIDDKIAKSEARISGYALIKYSLSELKTAYSGLNDLSDFASLKSSNSQPSAFDVVAGPTATAASYNLTVKAVAQGQRITTDGFATRNTSLNAGAAFNLTLSVNDGTAQTINVTTDTPAGIVSAINGSGTGLSAQLIQTSGANPWKVVITGPTGANQSYTLSSNSSVPLGLPAYDNSTPPVLQNAGNWVQSAQDAQLEVNGLTVSRSSNTVTDVVDGVTFNLYTPSPSSTSTVGGVTTTTYTPARVDLTRDTGGITAKVEALVKAYNEFEDNLKVLGDRSSEVEKFGGALANDSFVQSIRNQVRSLLIEESSTPGVVVKAPRDIGLSFDRFGVLQFDKDKLAARLQDNFGEVAQMFTANTNNLSVFSEAPAGVAGEAVRKLDALIRDNGLLAQQTDSANQQVKRLRADLTRLEDQMQKLLERYTSQFTTMESIVGRSNSLRDSLKNTFEGMANAYKR